MIEDICIKLNTLGTMNSLIRTKQGRFNIEDAVDLDKVTYDTKLLETSDVLDVKKLQISKDEKKLVVNGNKLNKEVPDGYYEVYVKDTKLALYEFKYKEGKIIMFY